MTAENKTGDFEKLLLIILWAAIGLGFKDFGARGRAPRLYNEHQNSFIVSRSHPRFIRQKFISKGNSKNIIIDLRKS
jgi:hypothetical protein